MKLPTISITTILTVTFIRRQMISHTPYKYVKRDAYDDIKYKYV